MNKPTSLLIVDDDEGIRTLCQDCLADQGYRVRTADSAEAALSELAREAADVVITDLKLPGMDGIDLIREIAGQKRGTTILAMTGKGTIKDTVELMREGAFDVLPKPFRFSDIQLAVDKALRHRAICHENEDLQKKLHASEKMAVIGRLSASVAHELNNPLDGVLRFVNMALERISARTEAMDDVERYLSEARTGLRRMANIVQSLLRFSRNVVVEDRPLPVQTILNDALSQLSHVLASTSIDVTMDLEDPTAPVPSGLGHVFANVIKNAFDAMEKTGGLLSIRSRKSGDRIQVSFEDTGCGIPEKDLARIFDPFFTTKPFGKGTGLGLSICARILESLGGTIQARRNPELGTTIMVAVPDVDGTSKGTRDREQVLETS
jgi:signal transduction histidine kinase